MLRSDTPATEHIGDMSEQPWNAEALQRRRWIMERLTELNSLRLGSPSLREMAIATGTVPSVIFADIVAMERLGYLRRGKRNGIGTIRVLMPFITGHVEPHRSDAIECRRDA